MAGSIGPSHGLVHATALAVPVTVLGLTVAPGSLVHADRPKAVVVPARMIPKIGRAIGQRRRSEQVILGPAREGFADWGAFEADWAAFERARV